MYTDLTEQVRPHEVGDAWQVIISKQEIKVIEQKPSRESYWKVKDHSGIWTFKEMKDAMLMSKMIQLDTKFDTIGKMLVSLLENAEVKLDEKKEDRKHVKSTKHD